MAEHILERWTRCPTGNIEDETFFEIVIEDDSLLPLDDLLPRTANVVRIFTRGTLMPPQGRDILLTQGSGVQREIISAIRTDATNKEGDVSSLGLTCTYGGSEPIVFNFSYYFCPSRGTVPTSGTRLTTYKRR